MKEIVPGELFPYWYLLYFSEGNWGNWGHARFGLTAFAPIFMKIVQKNKQVLTRYFDSTSWLYLISYNYAADLDTTKSFTFDRFSVFFQGYKSNYF